MACSTDTPKFPPFRCPQHIAWPVGDMQHIVVDDQPDGTEVVHVGFGLHEPKGIYAHRGIAEAVAEALATRLTQKAAA